MNDTVAKAQLKTDIKTAVLANLTGYTADDITVTFSKGSVKATVEITPKAGSDAVTLKASVATSKSTMQSAVLQKVKDLPNVSNFLESNMTVADLTITASDPVTSSSGSSSA